LVLSGKKVKQSIGFNSVWIFSFWPNIHNGSIETDAKDLLKCTPHIDTYMLITLITVEHIPVRQTASQTVSQFRPRSKQKLFVAAVHELLG